MASILKPWLSRAAVPLLITWSSVHVGADGDQGPLADPTFFPIAVWLQDPVNAAKYKDIGINVYVGLWRGPTEKQLAELKKHDMRVICSQLGKGKGYGPPHLPAKIIADYHKLKKADPTRPVFLNLGQGVAWDNYIGRGVRRNHPEDYPEYIKGCDIVSFDIYPAVHEHKDIAGKLWYVADGVSRLRQWSGERKPVWNCIECTHISNPNAKATPTQVKAEVWMSLVRGSRGLIYFVHQFRPQFIEAGLLADADMVAAIKKINQQIHELAPVLNGPALEKAVQIESSVAAVPVEAMVKRHQGATYVFAVAMRDGQTTATFRVAGVTGMATAHVLGENRDIAVSDGAFQDTFRPWEVHLYRIVPK
jgi:hypothetical protein